MERFGHAQRLKALRFPTQLLQVEALVRAPVDDLRVGLLFVVSAGAARVRLVRRRRNYEVLLGIQLG